VTVDERQLTPPACWLGADLADRTQWTVELSGAQRLALIEDTVTLRYCGVTLDTADAGTVAADELAPAVARIRGLLRERGVALVDGFPVEPLGVGVSIAFWCFGSLVGTPITQNLGGQRIDEVRNEGRATVRGAKTDRELIFHTDFANTAPDLFGLLAVRQARSGGESLLVSGPAVYRELAENHPTELTTLCAEFCFDRTGDVGADEDQVVRFPVFDTGEDGLVVRYNRARIHRGHRVAGQPLTAEQTRALDVLDGLLSHPRFSHRTTLRAGQALFVDNRRHLHSRTAFVDHVEPARHRRLLRVWLTADAKRR
jgi:TfdA family taurine catabolism dioxygenase TauD